MKSFSIILLLLFSCTYGIGDISSGVITITWNDNTESTYYGAYADYPDRIYSIYLRYDTAVHIKNDTTDTTFIVTKVVPRGTEFYKSQMKSLHEKLDGK